MFRKNLINESIMLNFATIHAKRIIIMQKNANLIRNFFDEIFQKLMFFYVNRFEMIAKKMKSNK